MNVSDGYTRRDFIMAASAGACAFGLGCICSEELAAAAVRDLVGRQDPEFEATAQRVLEKNRELYERLR